MIISCVLWIFAIYGLLHISIDILFQVAMKNVDILIKIDDMDTLEMVAKMMKYKLWYFNKVECEIKDNIRITNEDERVADKIYKDYGIRLITR